MELGNFIWGNSRGEYPVERYDTLDIFCRLMEAIDMDYHAVCNEKTEHTTPRGGYENDVFLINPYYWGDDDKIAEEPNFVYKPTNLQISWYKYPFRDAYANQDISANLEKFSEIIGVCVESVEADKK